MNTSTTTERIKSKEPIQTDIVIVGMGFSVIPLLRELKRTGQEFLIVSGDNSIWKNMEREGRLDFDLVSSYYSSFYSFDLVNDPKEDYYPTAREFYDMHKRHYQQYRAQVVNDLVESIDNYNDHSIIRTQSGTVIEAEKVVVATGFNRKIHAAIRNFDFDVDNQTIVVNSIGDSANLILAKLVTRRNKLVVLHDGFFPLDKQAMYDRCTFTVDQLEYHNILYLNRKFYLETIGVLPLPTNSHMLTVAHPETRREIQFEKLRGDYTKILNGTIFIKYWPIDEYHRQFGDDVEGAIRQGYLLNDIAYLISEKHIESWPKSRTTIDREHKVIRQGDRLLKYDHMIESDTETPRIPPITVHRNGVTFSYNYVYRENYLGVVPLTLRNIFFLGYTRPMTGGLANITEMQCLLVHKMITNKSFNNHIYGSLGQRLETYNKEFYGSLRFRPPGSTDHLVFYGAFTKEVARAIGIDINLRDCRSWRELNQWLFFPNAAFRFRAKGEYKVDGVNTLVETIDKNHRRFRYLRLVLFNYLVHYLVWIEFGTLLLVKNHISLFAFLLFLLGAYKVLFLIINPDLAHSTMSRIAPLYIKVSLLLVGMVVSAIYVNPWILLGTIAMDVVYTFMCRQLGFVRYVFNDLKYKYKYRAFFEQYSSTYNRLRKSRGEEIHLNQ